MKESCNIKSKIIMGLIVLVLSMLLAQNPAQGVSNCGNADDPDCDGFLANDESALQTDPLKPDLFIIFRKAYDAQDVNPGANYSLLDPPYYNIPDPQQFLQFLINGGLGITVHPIASALVPQTERNVTSAQKAIRLTESFDMSGTKLGLTQQSTPNGYDDGTVWTKRIEKVVTDKCGIPPSNKCKDSANPSTIYGKALIQKYIQNIIAHEAAHAMNVKYPCSPDIGCHYPTQTGVILDYSAYIYKSGGNTYFVIGSQYKLPEDKDTFQLR